MPISAICEAVFLIQWLLWNSEEIDYWVPREPEQHINVVTKYQMTDAFSKACVVRHVMKQVYVSASTDQLI